MLFAKRPNIYVLQMDYENRFAERPCGKSYQETCVICSQVITQLVEFYYGTAASSSGSGPLINHSGAQDGAV